MALSTPFDQAMAPKAGLDHGTTQPKGGAISPVTIKTPGEAGL
jgi:hypothetical protein